MLLWDWNTRNVFLGDLSDNHDILAMKLYELDLPENVVADTEDRSKINPSSSFFEPPRDHAEDPKPSSMSGLKVINGTFPVIWFEQA